MTTGTKTQEIPWSTRAKALAAALLVAAMIAAGVMAASPAHASTVFIVNSNGDAPDITVGNGFCDADATVGAQCTLRAAMQEANATAGADTIGFDIPATRPVNISILTPLPTINSQVTINGYTQPDARPNTLDVGNNASLRIIINGSGLSGSSGLAIENSSGSVIKGLAFNHFSNSQDSIFITGDSTGNSIQGNFIGTDTSGTVDQTDGAGVTIDTGSSGNLVGGTTPAARNLISGNAHYGIGVSGDDNRIQGNYVGTDRSGTRSLGNFLGINVGGGADASGNVIGGSTPAKRNVISGNEDDGVILFGSQATSVLGNRIGTTADGTAPLGNTDNGLSILRSASNNLIGDGTADGSNTIAFNGDDGVNVADDTTTSGRSTGNRISRNSLFSNAGLGIDLEGGFQNLEGATANDDKDADAGPNHLQNYPVLTSAKNSSTKTTITGKLGSTPGKTFKIQFFKNSSGNEGKRFIGERSTTTDPSGNSTFTFSPGTKVAAGQTITATATKTSTSDTSEFSAPRTVALATGSDLSPETTKISGPSGITNNPTAQFKFSSPDPDATFECGLDGGAYYGCSSPENVNHLSEGRHLFLARAVDKEGRVDQSPAQWIWAVDRKE